MADFPDSAATAYVRPHEVKLSVRRSGAPALPAVIRHINSAGPVVHVSLERADDGSPFQALLTKEECEGLSLQPSVSVFAALTNARVFAQEVG